MSDRGFADWGWLDVQLPVSSILSDSRAGCRLLPRSKRWSVETKAWEVRNVSDPGLCSLS